MRSVPSSLSPSLSPEPFPPRGRAADPPLERRSRTPIRRNSVAGFGGSAVRACHGLMVTSVQRGLLNRPLWPVAWVGEARVCVRRANRMPLCIGESAARTRARARPGSFGFEFYDNKAVRLVVVRRDRRPIVRGRRRVPVDHR